jgi:acetylornithine/succinyldiaminopimelate/putrescine aminotransferase
VSHGHAHPRVVRTLVEQAQRLAVTARISQSTAARLLHSVCKELTGLDRASFQRRQKG